MAQNPLLGNRISLISKKNIRYEGTLYSINENDATVALQNVKSFGTEGREVSEGAAFVGPQDDVHPYLLFRGCDIKDLHVHESAAAAAKPANGAAPPQEAKKVAPKKTAEKTQPQQQQQQQQGGRGGSQNRRPRRSNPQVGTGASLLNRKARGTVEGGPETPQEEFDFQSKLAEFSKEEDGAEDDEAGDAPDGSMAYEKDDFFDSISCDTLDKQSGIDNRLRGSQERSLNTETFGAVALNSQRRRRGRGRGGRGGGGRGRGRGGGRGRGRGGRGRGRGRSHYNNSNNNNNSSSNNNNRSNNQAFTTVST